MRWPGKRGGGTRFGAVLDATCDRISDGAVFCGLLWWAAFGLDSPSLMVATLICLVTSQVISYIKARAEATGLDGGGGLIERPSTLSSCSPARVSRGLRGSDAVPRGDVAAGGRQPGDRRSAPALGAQFAGRDRQDHRPEAPGERAFSENLSDWGAGGWRLVRTMPEPMARSVFRTGARYAALGGGPDQLRKNSARVIGTTPGRVPCSLMRASLASYARYWRRASAAASMDFARLADRLDQVFMPNTLRRRIRPAVAR